MGLLLRSFVFRTLRRWLEGPARAACPRAVRVLFPEYLLEKLLHLGPGLCVRVRVVSDRHVKFFRVAVRIRIREAMEGPRIGNHPVIGGDRPPRRNSTRWRRSARDR